MATKDTTPQPCGAIGPNQTTCRIAAGHDGRHMNAEDDVSWPGRDPLDPALIAGGQLTGNGATRDFRGGVFAGGASTGVASGGIGGGSSMGCASTHGQGGAGPSGGIHEPGSLRFAAAGGKSAGPERVLGVDPAIRCGAENVTVGKTGGTCKRTPGHYGAHDDDAGHAWSSGPPLGPVPDRFRHNVVPGTEGLPGAGYFSERMRPKGAGAAGPSSRAERDRTLPDATIEVLLAGLVACGRSLGQIDKELGARAHWKRVLDACLNVHGVSADSELTDEQWARIGRYIFASVQLVASERSEPAEPIQMRAEALAILVMKGQRVGVPPNFLIRAGAVLEVLRAAWRKSQRGGT